MKRSLTDILRFAAFLEHRADLGLLLTAPRTRLHRHSDPTGLCPPSLRLSPAPASTFRASTWPRSGRVLGNIWGKNE